jgi:hypothetical protein
MGQNKMAVSRRILHLSTSGCDIPTSPPSGSVFAPSMCPITPFPNFEFSAPRTFVGCVLQVADTTNRLQISYKPSMARLLGVQDIADTLDNLGVPAGNLCPNTAPRPQFNPHQVLLQQPEPSCSRHGPHDDLRPIDDGNSARGGLPRISCLTVRTLPRSSLFSLILCVSLAATNPPSA